MSRAYEYLGEQARWAAAYLNWEAGRQIYTSDSEGFWLVYQDQPLERQNHAGPLRISDERIIQSAKCEIMTSGRFEDWVRAQKSKFVEGIVA